MSVLIKGVEMPSSCQCCFASDDESRFCRAANKYIPMLGKPKFCPLVPVPPHGRLIDADALQVDMMEMVASGMCGEEDCIDAVIEAPTIIEAEGET